VFQGSLGGDLSLDDAGNLGGSLQLGFADLAFVESLVPALQQPAGRLQGRANFGGTLQAPRIDADVRVNEASFAVPALGIDVRDVGATLRSSNDNLLLQASAVSGEGELLLQAEVLRPLESSRELRARLEGSDFSLLAREDLQATISPALDLSFTEAALTLQGSVRVPRALIGLESLLADVSNGGVDVSRDVVVVQADTQALVAEQQRALPFNARLDLQLGDDVQLRGFGLDATLNGELRVEQEAGRPLLAYGELGMPRATYRIYSQELNARDGRLLFYGNPLNPSLDVRAFRETPSAEVGMLLSGTLGRIQSRLYSTPTLPENEILAILVTGKSFNDMNDQDGNALLNAVANFGIERGEGLTSAIGDKLGLDTVAINGGASYLDSSLGLGKYITPDLLLRYEIGLFDRQAVLSIDYALTERLRLEVRSGLSQSVDISYTIEKD
jgi:translocation and assembly module TamB